MFCEDISSIEGVVWIDFDLEEGAVAELVDELSHAIICASCEETEAEVAIPGTIRSSSCPKDRR